MSDFNQIAIMGNLCSDPEVRDAEIPVVSLRIASHSPQRDEGGEWTTKPNYFNVTAFKHQAQYAVKYLQKGSLVLIAGRLEYQQYEAKDGSGKRERVVIIAREVKHFDYPPKVTDEDPEVAEKVPF